jgi:hypothetical protein
MKTLAAALILAAAVPALAETPGGAPDPAPVAVVPAAPQAPARSGGYGKSEGVLPGMVIGPKLSLLRVPAPGLGVEAKLMNAFGLSLDYAFIPTVTVKDVSARYADLSLGAKWYPWRGAFFLGASLGTRTFEGSKKDSTTVPGVTLEAKGKVSSTYLAPQVGWRWVWASGFFMGIDLGWQVILSSETTLTIPAELASTTAAQDVRDASDDLGELGFPIVSLLQLGWFF